MIEIYYIEDIIAHISYDKIQKRMVSWYSMILIEIRSTDLVVHVPVEMAKLISSFSQKEGEIYAFFSKKEVGTQTSKWNLYGTQESIPWNEFRQPM